MQKLPARAALVVSSESLHSLAGTQALRRPCLLTPAAGAAGKLLGGMAEHLGASAGFASWLQAPALESSNNAVVQVKTFRSSINSLLRFELRTKATGGRGRQVAVPASAVITDKWVDIADEAVQKISP